MTSDLTPNALTESQACQYVGMSRSWLAQARMRGDPDAPPFLKELIIREISASLAFVRILSDNQAHPPEQSRCHRGDTINRLHDIREFLLDVPPVSERRFDAEVAAVYFISSVPFRISPMDLLSIVGFTLTVTLLACWIASRRAGQIEPAQALRYE